MVTVGAPPQPATNRTLPRRETLKVFKSALESSWRHVGFVGRRCRPRLRLVLRAEHMSDRVQFDSRAFSIIPRVVIDTLTSLNEFGMVLYLARSIFSVHEGDSQAEVGPKFRAIEPLKCIAFERFDFTD
jgi:hypothetical protein